jgi:hypothetical protein
MAQTSVPTVRANLQALLAARPALTTPNPVVPIYIADLGNWTDPEAIILGQTRMAGAAFVGWGAGEASFATVEPLTMDGYLFTAIGGNDQAKAAAAEIRAGVLLGEVMQQLRDNPTVNGALGTLQVPRRWQPPLMSSATWSTWMAPDPSGASVARVLVDFTITWSATT